MLYQREIDDSVLIQYIILFTLSKVDNAVPYNELINLVLDNCNINYGDFQVALTNLVKTDHVSTYLEGERNQKYKITDKGLNAIEFFQSSIPIYIREPIAESVKQLFIEERRRNAVEGDISPVRGEEFSADCVLRNDDKTELMRLSLYAGTRDEAERLARYFKSHPEEVYAKVIEAFDAADEEDNE